MILSCSKCATRYLVSDASDRRVAARCAAPIAATPGSRRRPKASEQAYRRVIPPPPAPESSSLRKRPPAPGLQPAGRGRHPCSSRLVEKTVRDAAAAAVIVHGLPFALPQKPFWSAPSRALSFLFEPFGIYYTEGLALADVSLSKAPQRTAASPATRSPATSSTRPKAAAPCPPSSPPC